MIEHNINELINLGGIMKTSWSWAMFLHLSLSSVDCACNSACDIQLKNKVPGMKKNVYMAYRKP